MNKLTSIAYKYRNQFMDSELVAKSYKKVLKSLHPLINGHKSQLGYISPPVFRALWPGLSGNEVNGLGKKKVSRPFRILWTADKETPYGNLQRFFLMLSGMKGTVKFSDHIHTRKLAQIEKKQSSQQPSTPCVTKPIGELTSTAKDIAKKAGGDIVGITMMKEEWVFQGCELPEWAYNEKGELDARLIVIGVEMDYDNFGVAPELPAATEAMKQYDRGTESALATADYLLSNGYHGWGHSGPRAGRILLVPAAIEAGLGQLGKHGSLISKEFGSSMRLGAVLTDAKLQLDDTISFGSEDFCLNCQICVNECPVNAISNQKKIVRGVEKYYVDFDRCLPYFMDNNGCGICASKCPYSRPAVRPKLLNKYQKTVK